MKLIIKKFDLEYDEEIEKGNKDVLKVVNHLTSGIDFRVDVFSCIETSVEGRYILWAAYDLNT